MPKRKWNKQGAHQKHKKRKSDEVKEKPKLSKSDTKKAVYQNKRGKTREKNQEIKKTEENTCTEMTEPRRRGQKNFKT